MTALRLLPASDRTWKPWKNGGGEMADIAASPAGAGLDAFDWRVGIARIERDGPFSDYPGIDRNLMIIGGKGIRLAVEGMETARLTHKSMPYYFPGDRPATATLIDGPTEALNVMTRREHVGLRIGRVVGPARFNVGEQPQTFLVWARGTADIAHNRVIGALGAHDAAILDSLAEIEIVPGQNSHGWLIEILPIK